MDDVLNDALSNLEHDNYEISYKGYENRQADVALIRATLAAQPAASAEPVVGDVLPPIGSRVFIRHGRDDDAHACTVTGYYAWGDLKGEKRLHRVFVRLVYEGTDTPQARMLCDCYQTAEAALAAPVAAQKADDARDAVQEFIDATDALLESQERKTWASGYVKEMTVGERMAVAARWRKARALLSRYGRPAVDMDEYRAMVAVMEHIDPATFPGLTAAQRCALSRFVKPQGDA